MSERLCELDGALMRAQAFLRSARGADHLWRDFRTLAGQSSEWVTAFVAFTLQRAASEDETAKSALSVLLQHQRHNGGWGYNKDVPADCDSTSWALLGLMERSLGGSNAIDRGVEFICQHQPESLNGGFSTYVPSDGIDAFLQSERSSSAVGWMGAHVCVTSVALQALLSARKSARSDHVTRGLEYLLCKRTTEGIWRSYWWKGHAYSTFQALKALSLAGIWSSSDALKVEQYFVARQQSTGAWGDNRETGEAPDAFETAFVLLALSLCNHAAVSHAVEQGVRWLLSAQNEDGSWPSVPILRIPAPTVRDPDRAHQWRLNSMGTGVIIRDEARLFTTAAVLWALVEWRPKV
jgi:squalene cyclase